MLDLVSGLLPGKFARTITWPGERTSELRTVSALTVGADIGRPYAHLGTTRAAQEGLGRITELALVSTGIFRTRYVRGGL